MSNQYLDCYRRVSTTVQKTEGNSLQTQFELGQKVSKKLGLKFRDRNEGSHSSTIGHREVLEELKDDIVSGKVKNIWIQDSSRLFRDVVKSMNFRKHYLQEYDVRLFEGEHCSEEVKFETVQDRMMYDIWSLVQQSENEMRTEKFQRGYIQRLKRDSSSKPVFMGGTSLFGYKNINKEWTIEKNEEKWVKFIFDSYENGETLKSIKNELDKNGILSRRGNLWSLGTLQKMLRNKTYTGIHSIHIKKIDKTFTYKTPKIISVSQFNRVQKKLNENHKYKENNKQHDSLLSRITECSCGTSIGSEVRQFTNNKGFKINTKKYFCLNKGYQWKGKKIKCNNSKSLDMDLTDELVLGLVRNTVSNSSLLKEKFKEDVMKQKKNSDKEIEEDRRRIENSIQRLQTEIENTENQIVDLEVDIGLGKRDQNIVKKIISRFEEELDRQRKEYEELEEKLDELDNRSLWLDWVGQFGKELDLKTKDSKKQKEFLVGVVDKIIIHSETDMVRGKETQIGHSFEIRYKMKIVNDSIQYLDDKKKSLGYDLIEGKNRQKTGITKEVTLGRGRKKVKKNG